MKKQKVIIVVISLIIIGVLVLLAKSFGLFGKTTADGEEAYVTTVSDIIGISGKVNYFSGVAEAQETWKIEKNAEYVVKEVYVSVGDTVKTGDPIFSYDEESFQEKLSQAEIDMERLVAEKEALAGTIDQLTKEKANASSANQANYTIQIKQQELELKQKELEIKSKQIEIDKLKTNIDNAVVKSGIDGIVQSVANDNEYYGSDNAFIKIMKTGNLRIKGSINEQNIGQIWEGMEVSVCSRVDNTVWQGTVTSIDRENQDNSNNNYYYGGDPSTQSTTYPFYIELEDSNGLMLGQHVYVKERGEEEVEGFWLDEFYVDLTDPEKPFVWADNGSGKLERRSITIAETDEELMRVRITDGLTVDDAIIYPSEELKVGQACVNINDMAVDDEMGGDEMGDGGEFGDMVEEGVVMEG